MRVLLIYPDLHVHVNYPVGLGVISSVLKKQGHETRILHFNEEMNLPLEWTVLEKSIIDFEPQLIAFSSVSNQFQYVKQMAAFIKKRWDIPVLLGGIHATIAAEKILNIDTIDILCRGEGEFAILDLIKKLETGENYTEIPNLGFKKNGKIKLNPIRPLIDKETVNTLPFPDREGFNFGEIVKRKNGWANVMASRGCLRNCSYCVNHYFHKLYSHLNTVKETLRYRNVDTVLREVEEMLDKYPWIQVINLDDDNITLNQDWLAEFCEEYPNRIGLPFKCNVHPLQFDLKRAKMISGAGCVEVSIGLESGSERIRRDILKRPMNDSSLIKAFSAAEEAGLRSWAFNMIGIPTETKDEILMTARLNAKIRPYIIRCSMLFPYEGTELYQYALDHNFILEANFEKVSSVFEDSVLNMPDLPREEIVKFKTMFKWYVDANSDIEASGFYQHLINLFEQLPGEKWASGENQKLFKQVDAYVDILLRELKMEHYASRHHLDLNFTSKLNYQLP